jgi:hypothetical protein
MKRRLTAWLTIVALLAGVALPAHALGHVMRAGAMGGDICSAAGTGKMPAQPAHDAMESCQACCQCSAGSLGIPGASPSPAMALAPVTPVPTSDARGCEVVRVTVLARGPPAFG